MAGGVGVEYRVDEIKSIPDEVAEEGLLLWFYFADGGAVGEKYTREFFSEIEMPLLAGKPGAKEVTVNLSARYTDDEFYGGAWTGAAKMGWRPIDSLLIRTTWGTSYRAPNLRELFLRGSVGISLPLRIHASCRTNRGGAVSRKSNYVQPEVGHA